MGFQQIGRLTAPDSAWDEHSLEPLPQSSHVLIHKDNPADQDGKQHVDPTKHSGDPFKNLQHEALFKDQQHTKEYAPQNEVPAGAVPESRQ